LLAHPIIRNGKLARRLVDSDVAQLLGFLEQDYAMLRLYLGESAFVKLAIDLVGAHPFETLNARWYCKNLSNYLQNEAPLPYSREIIELASLEQTLGAAFDAPAEAAVTVKQLQKFMANETPSMVFKKHPSVSRLAFSQNTTSIWSALKCEAAPPKPHLLDQPQEIIVWRQGTTTRFRLLGRDEAKSFDATIAGASFAQICEILSDVEMIAPPSLYAANYLHGWIEAELLVPGSDFAASAEK
jgi:hypothetical protein